VNNNITLGVRGILLHTDARQAMIVLHDDAKRGYVCWPPRLAPPQVLYDQAQMQGWTIVNMKNDWKQIFKFE
jgi:hypothetical protein